MSETVEFSSNGATASGYLAPAASGIGPGVIVVQEWWGLVPQIKGVCGRLAQEGFTALAPDLYRGEVAGHAEMDEAGRLMSEMPLERAAQDMDGALSYLLDQPSTTGDAGRRCRVLHGRDAGPSSRRTSRRSHRCGRALLRGATREGRA